MTENQEIKKREYEIAFLLKVENPSIISQSLVNKGFAILSEEPLVKIRLSYPIKKEKYAYFGYFCFEGDSRTIENLRTDLKLNPEILRYLIITPPFEKKSIKKSTPFKPIEFPLPTEPILTNEALEKKIEEILK